MFNAVRLEREIDANIQHLYSVLEDRQRILKDAVLARRARKAEKIAEKMRELSDYQLAITDVINKAESAMGQTKPLTAAAAIDSDTFPAMLAQNLDLSSRVAGLKVCDI